MSERKFTLYWSSLASYETCGQQFLWSRGWGTLDLGGGPGRPKPLQVVRSRHHAVMGMVLGYFWELLYNQEEWRHPHGLLDRLLEKCRKEFDRLLLKEFVDWRLSPSRDELWETIESGIRGYLRTMKEHKLLGPYARSEVDLACYLDQYTPIGGRADLIIRREDNGVAIYDGKNSRRYKDRKGNLHTYTDPDQLRWYALCFYLTYKVLPDQLGFVYFRYPYGEPVLDAEGQPTGETEAGLVYVPFTKDDLKGLAVRAKDALRSMNKGKFEANPVPSHCRFCDFETVCPQRQAQKQANSRNRKKSSDFFDGQTGFVTFGMGKGNSVVTFDSPEDNS